MMISMEADKRRSAPYERAVGKVDGYLGNRLAGKYTYPNLKSVPKVLR